MPKVRADWKDDLTLEREPPKDELEPTEDNWDDVSVYKCLLAPVSRAGRRRQRHIAFSLIPSLLILAVFSRRLQERRAAAYVPEGRDGWARDPVPEREREPRKYERSERYQDNVSVCVVCSSESLPIAADFHAFGGHNAMF